MPASTYEPVNAALRSVLTKTTTVNTNLDSQIAGSTKKALLTNIEFEEAGSYDSSVLDLLKSKYILLKTPENNTTKIGKSVREEIMGGDETISLPKHELYPLNSVQLGWGNCDWAVGAGMVNVGNTCYLNSILQALYHVPALVNWLISDKQSCSECEDSGSFVCIICAMRQTLQQSQQRNTNSIRPNLIHNKLRLVFRNFLPGRQEDAHEFLRYLVEAMEKSYLCRFKNHTQFDARTKETTPLNQILGGYLRSTVRCLDCEHISTTFQHFQDLLLDIRKAQTLEEALDACFTREHLDDESYHCESCKKKVRATKQFFLERTPMVLCIQLKRFSVTNNKITKHISFKQRLELTKYALHKPSTPLVYRLVALVSHIGPTVSCGHYIAVAQAPCGNFYQFDDSLVRAISQQEVFNTNAYIMLYELERAPNYKAVTTNGTKTKAPLTTTNASSMTKEIELTTSSASKMNSNHVKMNGSLSSTSDNNNRVYGPELPPSKLIKLQDENGAVSSTLNGVHKNEAASSTSSDSETEQVTTKSINQSVTPNKQTFSGDLAKKSPIKSTKAAVSSSSSSSMVASTSVATSTTPLKCGLFNRTNSSSSIRNQNSNKEGSIVSTTSHFKKLVPYEDDSSDDSRSHDKISTKAANGEWVVTSSIDNTPSDNSKKNLMLMNNNNNNNNNNNGNDKNTVSQLLKMSHAGYSSASVMTWSGTRSHLGKEVSNEKREERKRNHSSDDEIDQGRVKHVKTSNGKFKSNPGYNPIQEFHNAKNWAQTNGSSSSSHRQFYPTSKHRNRRNFQHNKNNYRSYRFRN